MYHKMRTRRVSHRRQGELNLDRRSFTVLLAPRQCTGQAMSDVACVSTSTNNNIATHVVIGPSIGYGATLGGTHSIAGHRHCLYECYSTTKRLLRPSHWILQSLRYLDVHRRDGRGFVLHSRLGGFQFRWPRQQPKFDLALGRHFRYVTVGLGYLQYRGSL